MQFPRKDLEELYAWFHTFQFGNNVNMNNDSDLKSINQELHQIFLSRRILGRDSDKSIGKMYTVDEKMEETGILEILQVSILECF